MENNNKREKASLKIFLSIILFIIPSIISGEENYTFADIAGVEEENTSGIETMAATVENTTEYNGRAQNLIYDYQMQNNPDGSKKMMVTTKGVFTMQFLVDTKEGAVTYLMADGTTKKFTLTPEEKEKLFANYQLSIFNSQLQNIYAKAVENPLSGGEGATAIDGTYKASLDTDTLETDDIIIKVDKKRSNKEYAYVEWGNKRAKDIERQIEEKIRQAEEAPATKEGAKKMKAAFVAQMKKNKDKVIKTTIARRIEKINTRTGQVEETEFYNNKGEKIGHTKVKQLGNIECNIRNARLQMADGKLKDKKTIQIPIEMETEMEGINGKSRIKTRIKNVKVNEGVEFRWIKAR